MNGFDVILILVVMRLALPVCILLFAGELVRRHDVKYWARS